MARRSLASRRMTPMGALARGALAGVAGTLVMDLVGYLRFRSGGGEQRLLAYEFSPDLKEWEQAPAPGQMGKRLFEGLLQRPLSERYAALTGDLTHWSYGAA
ncbi:MAG: hypothetical protein ACRDID_05780 [Ktedonobacterales bacterium]